MLNEKQTLSISKINEEVILSNHAEARIKQRGIKKDWLALLLEYGHYIYQNGKHAYTVSLDKSGLKEIKKKFGERLDLTKLRSLYLILSDESVVVTCAYR